MPGFHPRTENLELTCTYSIIQYNKQHYLAKLLPFSIEWRQANFIHGMKSKEYPLPHDKRHQKKKIVLSSFHPNRQTLGFYSQNQLLSTTHRTI